MNRSHPLLALLGLAIAAPLLGDPVPPGHNSPDASGSGKFVFSLLPKSLQRKPQLDFNVITEVTSAGKKLTPPTPDKPTYYVAQAGKFTQLGSATYANEKAPPTEELAKAMQRSLATTGYLANPPAGQAPRLIIVFNFGSFARFDNSFDEFEEETAANEAYEDAVASGSTTATPPIPSFGGADGAYELLRYVLADPAKRRDVIERASIVGGSKFAVDLGEVFAREVTYRVSGGGGVFAPEEDPNSPFHRFADDNEKALHLVEESFSSCYFVIASAYDYTAVGKGARVLLWRTKMTVNSIGVAMTETLPSLIASAGPYFGRPMDEAAVLNRTISRDGRVDVGTPTVVEEDVSLKSKSPAKKTNP